VVHPSEEWSAPLSRLRLKHVDLRSPSSSRSDTLRGQLAELVRERQVLREQRASTLVLEQNRLAIVQTQHELARTLVSEHAEAFA
jgi:hypothetical protein